ncbi:IclR family transcriptional regulator [Actinomycetospora termitidis]|uniref:IclR family transcriptional regulator n=1 Tax=Actinomycetospora termitidis TaxID=3053470 RepID=A0ABT7MGI9_9PSEU|nr:IclR family transcriptional regulator [Actinomycetospora sp. Odt1-22]MDL5159057.1 IclR family transcriptional regulator [Actinomycetospora sp. Odt1-22]
MQTGPDDGAAPRYPLESVDRTLTLLRQLADRREVALAEVRAHLGVGQSTAHRLLAMLVYRGFAVQDPVSRKYRPGPAFADLGRAAEPSFDLVEVVRPVLVALAAETGETVHLGELVGTDVRYLDVIESASTLRVASRAGQTRPAHATSIGKAMLATHDDEAVRALYPDGIPAAGTSRAVTDVDALLAELRRVRSRGSGRNRGEVESGVSSVGVAIGHPAHGLLGGLSVAAPEARWSAAIERDHVAALRTAAERVLARVP